MHRNEWKWKHNNPKPVGHLKKERKKEKKAVLRGRFIALQVFLKKEEKS